MFGVIVFASGFVVMVLEIAGSRVIAPFVGSSLPVWTSLIGIILASLSLGYYFGGILADKKPKIAPLITILLLASVFIAAIPLIQAILMPVLISVSENIKLNAILATTALFAVPSFLLGMVSPYSIRLKLNKVDKSGETAGNLYALSTIGSIAGTFIAGFILISHLKTGTIILILSLILLILATSIILKLKAYKEIKNFFWVCLTLFLFLSYFHNYTTFSGIKEFDTQYNKVWIYNQIDPNSQKTARYMRINNESSSAMFPDSNELVFDYTKYYHLDKFFHKNPNKALMIGGAAYSYPKDYLRRFPKGTIDVVEIDPKLTDLAVKYFSLKLNPRLVIYHEDGRTFLNRSDANYDVIYNDAYSSAYSVPFQLTTQEAVKRMYLNLSENGLIMSNVISSIEGKKSKFLKAELATYRSVFPYVYVFAVKDPTDKNLKQNIMVIATKKGVKDFNSKDKEITEYLKNKLEINSNGVKLLTDDFAPVDQYNLSTL